MIAGYIIPGSVLYSRYYKKSFFGFIFIEILPYIVCAVINEGSLVKTFAAILALYSFYEMGYLWNDKISVTTESRPSIREGFEDYKLKAFFIIRITMSSVFIYALCKFNDVDFYEQGILTIFILTVFYLHNTIKNPDHRLPTFIILNTLKITFVFWLSHLSMELMLGFVPFLFIKTINYLRAKKIFPIEQNHEQKLYFPIFLAFIVVTPIIYIKALPACLVFGIIYNTKKIKEYYSRAHQKIFKKI